MPLPQKVIEQLGREPPKTSGWAPGALLFSGGLLFIAVMIYAGLVYGYEPYLTSDITNTQNQINTLSNSISATDQTQLIDFYSQLSNLQTLLQGHVLSSQFFTWLEKNTEANVYYQSFALASGNQVTMTGDAASEADVNQQVSIFENSPEVQSVAVSSVSSVDGSTDWKFTVTLTMAESIFLQSTQ